MILNREGSVTADNTVDCNRPDTVLTDWQNNIAVVMDTAIPLTHNPPNSEKEKITKYEILTLGIKNIYTLEVNYNEGQNTTKFIS